MRQLIAGNWKMNGTAASLGEIEAIAQWVGSAAPKADVLICPPATLIVRAASLATGRIAIGGQDCRAEPAGAFTGDISAEMLRDSGASAVIVGHSERRQYHGETDAMVAAKAMAAWRAGLSAIICVGENEAQRGVGEAHRVVVRQVGASVPADATAATTTIAYEPVWAIGTGRTPAAADIGDMHALIRDCLPRRARDVRIVYGGSVNPANAGTILAMPGVDGVLVGGASLNARDFCAIIGFGKTSL